MTTEKATFGGGCFWCIEAAYKELAGVNSVTSGYADGDTSDPSYRAVYSGSTGHVEVLEIPASDRTERDGAVEVGNRLNGLVGAKLLAWVRSPSKK